MVYEKIANGCVSSTPQLFFQLFKKRKQIEYDASITTCRPRVGNCSCY